jgi:PPOX class probable F420-dependent enzyme
MWRLPFGSPDTLFGLGPHQSLTVIIFEKRRSLMIDFNTDLGKHVHKRLLNEKVIWLTTVSSDGTPQPNPVWFFWDGEYFIIFTPWNTAKLNNIDLNSSVSLNFEGATPQGGDVTVFIGSAEVENSPLDPDPGYVEKYTNLIAEVWEGRTVDDFFEEYNSVIRIQPTKLRGFF